MGVQFILVESELSLSAVCFRGARQRIEKPDCSGFVLARHMTLHIARRGSFVWTCCMIESKLYGLSELRKILPIRITRVSGVSISAFGLLVASAVQQFQRLRIEVKVSKMNNCHPCCVLLTLSFQLHTARGPTDDDNTDP